ncbi:MAG: hypothetical protein ACJ8LD_10450, partial [Pantoea agglomerans]
GEGSMKKLTAEKCRSVIEGFKWMAAEGPGMSIRDEYDIQAYELALPSLEQQERGEGDWIAWRGGVMPVGDKSWVDIKWIDGSFSRNTLAAIWDWEHHLGADNIIAYRIIPERATNQNGEQ